MNTLHVKKGDTVMVISGSDANLRDKEGNHTAKIGKVLSASPKAGTVVVEGVNIRIRHTRARGGQNGQQQEGGRIEREMPISASKVMLYCEKCKKPTRIQHKLDGDKKTRVCKHCGADLG
nr:50S ribosomal protein L24 [bacterium]